MDRAKLKVDLIVDEGRLLTAYRDSKGLWTIGIGHLLGDSARMVSITPAECDALYEADVAAAEAIARRAVRSFETLDDARQRALVNMAFNRGSRMLSSSTITPAINGAAEGEHAWARVTAAIAGSPWAVQVKGRASRLAFMLEHGKDWAA